MQSFVLEFIVWALLMFVIPSVGAAAKEMGFTAGIAIGGVIALEAMFAWPICGACMNPVRLLLRTRGVSRADDLGAASKFRKIFLTKRASLSSMDLTNGPSSGSERLQFKQTNNNSTSR